MKKITKRLSVLLVCLFMVFGCQYVADELVGKKPEGAKTINITMVAKSSVNPVFLSANIGAEAAAKEISEKYSMIDVKIEWRTPKSESANDQAEKIANAIKDGTDAIIVSCSDDSILTEAIKSNKVDVIIFDSLSTLNVYERELGEAAPRFIADFISKVKSTKIKVLFLAFKTDLKKGTVKETSLYVDEVLKS